MISYEPLGKRDINLLPKKLKQSRVMWKILRKMFLALFVLVGAGIIVSFVFLVMIYAANREKALLEEQIGQLKPVVAIKSEYSAQQANLKKIQSYFKSVSSPTTPAYDFLKQFENVIPVDVSLLSINYNDAGKVDIVGISKNDSNINDLVTNLKKTARFSEVFLSHISKATDSKSGTVTLNFSISCKLAASQPDASAKPKATPASKNASPPKGSSTAAKGGS